MDHADSLSTSETAEAELRVHIAEYQARQIEIRDYTNAYQRLLYFQLLAAGAVVTLSWSLIRTSTDPQAALNHLVIRYALLLIPIVLLSISWASVSIGMTLVWNAEYIENHLRPQLLRLTHSSAVLVWEDYLRKQRAKHSGTLRGVIGVLGQGLFTFVVPTSLLIAYSTQYFYPDILCIWKSDGLPCSIGHIVTLSLLLIVDLSMLIITAAIALTVGRDIGKGPRQDLRG